MIIDSFGMYKVIEEWLIANNITNYKIIKNAERQNPKEPKYIIDVSGDVNIIGYNKESEFPSYIKFGKISGNFICSYSRLTSMRGFPETVDKNFDISFSHITSLEDAPTEVNNFVACGLPFTEQQIREKIQEMKKQIKGKVYC